MRASVANRSRATVLIFTFFSRFFAHFCLLPARPVFAGRPDDFGRDDYKGRIISLELVVRAASSTARTHRCGTFVASPSCCSGSLALALFPRSRAPLCASPTQTNIPPEAPLEVAPAHAPVKRLPKTSSFEVTGVVGGAPGGPGKVTL